MATYQTPQDKLLSLLKGDAKKGRRTNHDIAVLAGVNDHTVANWLRGHRMTFCTACVLIKQAGITAKELEEVMR